MFFITPDETKFHIPPRPRYKQLPQVMTLEEVYRIIDATGNLKHRTLLMTTYTAGLRVSEVVSLRPEHIESDRMLIRVEQGKGRKDRYTILAQTTLDLLKAYWFSYRPGQWLFFTRNRDEHMHSTTAQKIFYNAKKKAGITSGKGIHSFRHSFASHHLEQGTDIYTIKKMMGHSSLKTTLKYLHVEGSTISKIRSPMDNLPMPEIEFAKP
jgi:site-specific recombinase XerD